MFAFQPSNHGMDMQAFRKSAYESVWPMTEEIDQNINFINRFNNCFMTNYAVITCKAGVSRVACAETCDRSIQGHRQLLCKASGKIMVAHKKT